MLICVGSGIALGADLALPSALLAGLIARREEPLPAGNLVALAGPVPMDPAVRPALADLQSRPISVDAAIARIRKHAEDDVLDQLLRTGQIHQIALTAHRLRRNHYRWPAKNRGRVAVARSELLGALFDGRRPQPVIAAIISLLYGVDGLDAVMDLNDAGVHAVAQRADDIANGDWADRSNTAEVNLALTTAEVLPALR